MDCDVKTLVFLYPSTILGGLCAREVFSSYANKDISEDLFNFIMWGFIDQVPSWKAILV